MRDQIAHEEPQALASILVDMETEAMWAECAWRMHQLQAAALWLRATPRPRGRAFLLRLLRAMEALRAFVDTTVLALHPSAVGIGALRDAAQLVAAVSDEFDWQNPSREVFARERDARLQQELEAIAILEDDTGKKKDCERLRAIIVALREREQSLTFHRGVLFAVKEAHGAEDQQETEYSSTNFAYGNTPLDTWARVCASPVIQYAVQKWSATDLLYEQLHARKEKTPLEVTTPIVVAGSSSGPLVFFTAAILGHACTGIEILPYLHSVAEELKETYKPSNCEFLRADVLATTLHGARLVVLTSQCWDDDLYAKVILKLEKELTVGCLVVDYRDGLSRSKCFNQSERVDGLRVSWNPAQSFFINERLEENKRERVIAF